MRFLLLICCCSHILATTHAQEINANLSEIIMSGQDIITAIVEGIPMVIPPAEQIIQLPLQIAIGLPAEILYNVLNNICAILLATGNIDPLVTPDITKMNFELRKPCARIKVPLLKAEELWSHAEFNASRPVVIAVSGFTTNVNNSVMLAELAKAYNCRDDNNFVALDAAGFIDTLYTWSAFNSEEIGRNMAIGLIKLSKIVPIRNVHLIGHSLGAQIVGYAARFFQNMTGESLPYLTGLDPANPCFKRGQVLEPIERGIADFIDIIHSNPNSLGKRQPLGDVDFYPNGYQPLQPGCILPSCSHERSWKYYAETVYPNNAYDFPARACTTLSSLLAGFCYTPDYPMGYAVPKDITGPYMLAVNKDEPYGMNASREFQPSDGPCGRCNEDVVDLN